MQLWEYVLKADAEYDLSSPAAVSAWIYQQRPSGFPFHPGWVDSSFDQGDRSIRFSDRSFADLGQTSWPSEVVQRWQDAVHSLRDLARRLKGCRTGRKPDIDPKVADMVFSENVAELRPVVMMQLGTPWEPGDDTPPLIRKNFAGLRLAADPRIEVLTAALRAKDKESAVEATSLFIRAFTAVFWQSVFGSMLTDYFAPICATCGVRLGLTPKGRRPRAGKCRRCQQAEQYASEPLEVKRARWRKNKAEERARLKHTTRGKR